MPTVPVLEHLCLALLYPDEGLKASALSVWLRLLGSPAPSVPTTIRDRVCSLLLQTLAAATSPQLIDSCIGETKAAEERHRLDQSSDEKANIMTCFNDRVKGELFFF